MHLKLTVLALLTVGLIVCASGADGAAAFSDPSNTLQSMDQNPRLGLDIKGRRGLVLFRHNSHESFDRVKYFVPPSLNKPNEAASCVVCHHRRDTTDPSKQDVTDVTDPKQFQKCANCHKPEGDPLNFVDQQGYELNTREAYHRLCIGCHVTKKEMALKQVYKIAKSIPGNCGQCHDREAEFIARAEAMQPLVGDTAPNNEGEHDFAKPEVVATPSDPPIGFAGPSWTSTPKQTDDGTTLTADRWRIGFPKDPRYKQGSVLNPYRQNVLKGDYPIFGQNNFMVLVAESESIFNARRIPVPSNVSSQNPDSQEFFGRGRQLFFSQYFTLSFELFRGDTAFKPVDWRFHITPVFNINYLATQENGLVNVDFRRGNTRTDGYIALQEAFGDVRLGDTPKFFSFLRGRGGKKVESPYFDTTTVRAGIQPFTSDFRGFIFSDINLGVRLFGNHANNRYQFNSAYFYMLEKDTNSELNTPHFRNQAIFIANIFRQDTWFKGYTSQFSFHFNNDRPSRHFDENDFLVRPSLIGDVAPHGVHAYYLGWAGDGHMGRFNITHAFYQALGQDSRNPIAGRKTDINARMAASELSIDRDWLRLKASFLWASGDKKPFDDKATGFDSIQDLQEFAGGRFSFWNSQAIPLTNTAVLLTTPGSLLPDLRSSKLEGQANFVNPGIFIYNLGTEAELTPKLRAILNLNYSHFHHTEPLSELLFQPGIRKPIGVDYGIGFLYRPMLSENSIISAGFSSLIPGSGFRDIYSSNCDGQSCGAKSKILYSAFVKLKFTY